MTPSETEFTSTILAWLIVASTVMFVLETILKLLLKGEFEFLKWYYKLKYLELKIKHEKESGKLP